MREWICFMSRSSSPAAIFLSARSASSGLELNRSCLHTRKGDKDNEEDVSDQLSREEDDVVSNHLLKTKTK